MATSTGPPHKVPPILYRYCDLRGLDILRNLRVKVTPFNELNDPFEVAPRMEPELAFEEAKTSIFQRDVLQGMYRRMTMSGEFQGSYDDFVSILQQHTNKLARDLIDWYPGEAAKFRREHVNNVSREFGLICFSAVRDDILMWSHYTRGHTGFVIGFPAEASLFSIGPPVHEVEYLEERVLMGYVRRRDDPRLRSQINALIRRKSPHWEYEAEWRQLHFLANCVSAPDPEKPDKVNYYFPIDASSISEMILGCRCTDTEVHRILQAKQFAHVQLYLAVQHEELFKLSIRVPTREAG
jgi:hypothetical protein